MTDHMGADAGGARRWRACHPHPGAWWWAAIPPEDVGGDSVRWETFQPDTKAIEFRFHLDRGGRYIVSPPGVTVVERTLGFHGGRHVILSICWWRHLPIEGFVATSMDDGFLDAMRGVEAGGSTASFWGVAGGACLAVDDIRPHVTDGDL